MQYRSEDTQLEALSVALQHPAVATDQGNICRILQVSKVWRAAVKQSSACVTHVSFRYDVFDSSGIAVADFAMQLTQFGRWVSAYAGTIRSVDISLSLPPHELSSSLGELAQSVMVWSLTSVPVQPQLATASRPGSSTTAGVAPLPTLKLQEFTCCTSLASMAVLSALPAATLTQLSMTVPSTLQLQDALGRLSNLRTLSLQTFAESLLFKHISSVSSLRELTHLTLSKLPDTNGLELLPQQIRVLNIRAHQCVHQPYLFPQLTQLQQLQMVFDVGMRDAVALPPQLQKLDIFVYQAAISTLQITSLQQLQHLSIDHSYDGPQELLLLQQLPQLESIDLAYEEIGIALWVAPAWPQLKQLSALHLQCDGDAVEMAALIQAVSQLSTLTQLQCDLTYMAAETDNEADGGAAVHQLTGVCHSLKYLTQLRVLELALSRWVQLEEENVLPLSSLTGLTKLSLDLNEVLDDTKLIALLLSLTGLQELSVNTEQPYALPVIGRLQGLTALTLGVPVDLQQSALSYLTGLRNLRQLTGLERCSNAALREFWDNLRS